MNRPDLDAARKLANERVFSTRIVMLELLAYIAELENLVNSMGDEWETEHALDEEVEFEPPVSLQNALCVAIRNSQK
jgi:hypothetical protein